MQDCHVANETNLSGITVLLAVRFKNNSSGPVRYQIVSLYPVIPNSCLSGNTVRGSRELYRAFWEYRKTDRDEEIYSAGYARARSR
jgi:hypothetical protein